MNESLENLAHALREEMQEYGELLALLGEQQEAILARNVEEVAEIDAKIDLTALTIQQRRQRRDDALTEAARAVRAPEGETLREILPSFPVNLQPMFSALIDEVNDLLEVTRKKARQNQVLLGKILETTHDVLRALRPDSIADTYNSRGGMAMASRGKMAVTKPWKV